MAKNAVDSDVIKAREMWDAGVKPSEIYNATGKFVTNDGSVYSESGKLQMTSNGGIIPSEGSDLYAQNKGGHNTFSEGTHGQSLSEVGRQTVVGRGDNQFSGGLDSQTGKSWTTLNTETRKQYTDTFRRYISTEPHSELGILKDAYISQYGNEKAATQEMAKQFYEDLYASPVVAENKWGNFIPELPKLIDEFNQLMSGDLINTRTPHPASVESIRQTYEKLITEQQAANVQNLAAENKVRDLTDVYREKVQPEGAGADAVSAQPVENSAGQGYNGINTLEKLYDEAVHGKGTEGAGELSNITDGGKNAQYTYKNNPMENPKAGKDIIEDPKAMYGYSPNPLSERIGRFADFDWTNKKLSQGREKPDCNIIKIMNQCIIS
ncbi:hypothetical protein AAFA46_00875 [Oscillospiraceae bacterium WX1]